MNLNNIEAIERVGPQEDAWLSNGAETSERHRPWSPEDIAEPDSWTLASFDDLVPLDVAGRL